MNSKTRKLIFLFFFLGIFLFFFVIFASSGIFEGLEPGVSTKKDADQVLGTPIREIIPGERYDYDPTKYDARRISIKFNMETQVIETIDLYFLGKYKKPQYKEWFELDEPEKTASDPHGNLIEYYTKDGISLHFERSEATSYSGINVLEIASFRSK